MKGLRSILFPGILVDPIEAPLGLLRWLSPSIHKSDDELIYSGLSAALGHEPFGSETSTSSVEPLKAELLGPNGVSNFHVKNY